METTLKAERRDGTGKGAARKLRAAGRVPAVLYGHGAEPALLSVASQDLLHLFRQAGGSVLIDLKIDGKSHLAIPKEVQRDHLHGRYVHVDFLAVRRDELIKVQVEVRAIGDAPGVKAGGVVEFHTRELEIEAIPTNVPEYLELDVSELEIGQSLKAGDVTPPEGVTILADPEETVLSVITPAALRTEADLTLPGEEAPEAEGEAAPAAEEAAPAADEGGEEA
ncbi:MAG: 50S ribosomal protein L25 [Planctomycetaceae bacterium]